jgi:nucleolar protein 14
VAPYSSTGLLLCKHKFGSAFPCLCFKEYNTTTMAKRKTKAKRSVASIPKGLPVRAGAATAAFGAAKRKNAGASAAGGLFEGRANKKLKQDVLGRYLPGSVRVSTSKTNARAMESRQTTLKQALRQSAKSNSFVDLRIGEGTSKYAQELNKEDIMLKRLVKERVMRSKRQSKFDLADGDNNGGEGQLQMTHGGQAIDPNTYTGDRDAYLMDSDNDEAHKDKYYNADGYDATLSRADTELHFGGGKTTLRGKNSNPYGPQGGSKDQVSLGDAYRTRKEELDEMIARRKDKKAIHHQHKEDQLDTFDKLDDQFSELTQLLTYSKKKNEKSREEAQIEKAKESADMKEMDEWNKEVKELLFERKVAATDRTKTPEEIAKEKADELHELESKRLARMSGDFDPKDDLSDVESSSDEEDAKGGKKKSGGGKKKSHKNGKGKTKPQHQNPDELDESEEDEELQTKFTSEGLVYLDKEGKIVGKVGESEDEDEEESSDEEGEGEEMESDGSHGDGDDSAAGAELEAEAVAQEEGMEYDEGESDEESDSYEEEDDDDDTVHPLKVGAKVKGAFRAKEQFAGHITWYNGVVKKVYKRKDTQKGSNAVSYTYDVEYDEDDDFEEGMESKYVKARKKTEQETKAVKLTKKRQKAKEQARYVFYVVMLCSISYISSTTR